MCIHYTKCSLVTSYKLTGCEVSYSQVISVFALNSHLLILTLVNLTHTCELSFACTHKFISPKCKLCLSYIVDPLTLLSAYNPSLSVL